MRKKNSVLNVGFSVGYYFLAIVFNLISHSILVKVLGIEYSGINGLFVNVLNLMSIAELGIGNIIIYKLYKPIADQDVEKIKSWLHFYKKCYMYICFIIIVLSLFLCPFIKNIVGETNIKENIYILYFIAISNVLASYILSYKRSLLNASQKNYIVTLINMVYLFLLNIIQVGILLLFKNYALFMIAKTLLILVSNIYLNNYVNKKYPYVLGDFKELNKNEVKDVFKRIGAIFFEKVSYVVNKGIDSILITTAMGVAIAGMYSNYQLIAVTLVNILFKVFVSIIPSVGNLIIDNDKNKNFDIYKKLFLFNSFFVGLFITCFASTINSFISIWVGNEYILSNFIIYSFAVYIYSDGIRYSIMCFRDGAGICLEDRHMYLFAIIVNLVLSIVLCNYLGIAGVIIGTSISYLLLVYVSYPIYTFKKLFNKPLFTYYVSNLKFLFIIILSLLFNYFIVGYISFTNYYYDFIIKAFVSAINWIIIFSIIYGQASEYRYFIKYACSFFTGLKRKVKNEKRI